MQRQELKDLCKKHGRVIRTDVPRGSGTGTAVFEVSVGVLSCGVPTGFTTHPPPHKWLRFVFSPIKLLVVPHPSLFTIRWRKTPNPRWPNLMVGRYLGPPFVPGWRLGVRGGPRVVVVEAGGMHH